MKAYIVDAQIFANYDCSIEKKVFDEAGIEFVIERCKNEEEIAERCADAEAILDIYTPMGPKSMDKLKNCKVLVRYGIGYDTFDVEAATQRGIKVCNIPHYCIPEVATHASALILATSRQLLNYTMTIRRGEWNAVKGLQMRRPSSQIVGLAGFGNIAREVAKRMQALEYQVVAYDPFLDNEMFKKAGVKRVELEELFKTADIISLHTPLTKETEHLVNKDTIAQMKDGVIIVNTARGPIVCQEDLLEALQSGKVAAAGLDVFETEPFKDKDHPFCRMDNVILSPHASFNSLEASAALSQQVAETAVAVLKGEVPYNVVNKKELGL